MHLSTAELDAALPAIREAPADGGVVELIVRRPASGEREVVEAAELDVAVGLVGDIWKDKPSRKMGNGQPNPLAQLTLINTRAIAAVSPEESRRPLAGDQIHVDLDLSERNLPPGTRLAVGSAVIEVTDDPHTGCAKFVERFGKDAMRWVNSRDGRALRLRGMNCRVLESGTVRRGDVVKKLP